MILIAYKLPSRRREWFIIKTRFQGVCVTPAPSPLGLTFSFFRVQFSAITGNSLIGNSERRLWPMSVSHSLRMGALRRHQTCLLARFPAWQALNNL
jgi:hypothetical protein